MLEVVLRTRRRWVQYYGCALGAQGYERGRLDQFQLWSGNAHRSSACPGDDRHTRRPRVRIVGSRCRPIIPAAAGRGDAWESGRLHQPRANAAGRRRSSGADRDTAISPRATCRTEPVTGPPAGSVSRPAAGASEFGIDPGRGAPGSVAKNRSGRTAEPSDVAGR